MYALPCFICLPFFQAVATHYTAQITKQWYELVGSLHMLGDPAGLLHNLGNGFYSLYYEPRQGLVQGPEQFVKGMAKGTDSFVRHSVYGADLYVLAGLWPLLLFECSSLSQAFSILPVQSLERCQKGLRIFQWIKRISTNTG